MALILPEGRVLETALVTGTSGFYRLQGPSGPAFLGFASEVGNGNTVDFVATNGTDFELSTGTFTTGTPNEISRGTLIRTSNSNLAVNWATDTEVDIFATIRGGIINLGAHDLNGSRLTISAAGTSHGEESSTTAGQVNWTVQGQTFARWVTTAESKSLFQLFSTISDANPGPFFALIRDINPTPGQGIGEYQFLADNVASESITYAALRGIAGVTTDGAEIGGVVIRGMSDGTAIEFARFYNGQILIGKPVSDFADTGFEADTDGRVFMTRSEAAPLHLNRLSNEGTILVFYNEGVTIGNITSSGGTVTLTPFHGSHAAQWAEGYRPMLEPPPGTLVSATDEACDVNGWSHLPRVRITHRRACRRIYGLYEAARDEPGSFNVGGLGTAPTMARLIGPVENGDLLWSSEVPGVAERQPDDFVRACTLGKCTRGDDRTEERLVPCVLKAS